MNNKPLRIMAGLTDDGGCGWYRIRQPFYMIHEYTPHDTFIIDKNDDMLAVTEALKVADLVVLRPGAEKLMEMLKHEREFNHLKYVLDIDDNVELISPYSEHYQEYGTAEFYDRNQGKWLWKDGEKGWNMKKNQRRVDSLVSALKEVDMVTVTTPTLAEYARQYNKKVEVLPNAINFERWWRLPLRPNEKLRVGWSGGISHYEDFYEIKKPLNDLMRKYQFTLVMIGSHWEGLVDPDNRHLLEVQDWVPFKGHSYRMMCMSLDIAIIPLADLPFNYYKSAIKWYEMSALGIPSVVSNVTPYKGEVTLGNSLPYGTPEEFSQQLEAALKDVRFRREVGGQALKWVKENRDAKKLASLWPEAYSSVLTDRK